MNQMKIAFGSYDDPCGNLTGRGPLQRYAFVSTSASSQGPWRGRNATSNFAEEAIALSKFLGWQSSAGFKMLHLPPAAGHQKWKCSGVRFGRDGGPKSIFRGLWSPRALVEPTAANAFAFGSSSRKGQWKDQRYRMALPIVLQCLT